MVIIVTCDERVNDTCYLTDLLTKVTQITNKYLCYDNNFVTINLKKENILIFFKKSKIKLIIFRIDRWN